MIDVDHFKTSEGGWHEWCFWYDSRIGKWLSEDRIGFYAGDENTPRYVGNKATKSKDPTGLVGDGYWELGD